MISSISNDEFKRGEAMNQWTDDQLIEEIRLGNTDAYRILVERYKDYIFTLIYRMVGQRETAEDLAQETFIRMYRSLSRFRGEASFKTWIYRIAVNLAADYRKSRKRKPYEAILDKVKDWFAADRSQEPEQQMILKEQQQIVHDLLNDLPDKYRMIIYLYHLRQCSYQEISEITQLPLKTIETRLYRGKKLLKDKWLEVHGTDEQTRSQATSWKSR